eukprot:TRINITY_DN2934_c1_g1_i1.p1 TRINITY_DN2934_c1_g1~~TRINITY_DN2934_c1_g1_i1.p1  ORF type:complete len:169 (+),score=6.22 TRINITY_DN2934_c1_g1_i1:50-556(+)
MYANVVNRLEQLAERQNIEGATRFHGDEGEVAIRSYLERLREHSGASEECYVLACIYLDRVGEATGLWVDRCSAHRLILVAVLVATKYRDDKYYSNIFFAKIGGITPASLNALERDFLKAVSFTLHVAPLEFDHYVQHLQDTEPPRGSSLIVPTPYEPPVLHFHDRRL